MLVCCYVSVVLSTLCVRCAGLNPAAVLEPVASLLSLICFGKPRNTQVIHTTNQIMPNPHEPCAHLISPPKRPATSSPRPNRVVTESDRAAAYRGSARKLLPEAMPSASGTKWAGARVHHRLVDITHNEVNRRPPWFRGGVLTPTGT